MCGRALLWTLVGPTIVKGTFTIRFIVMAQVTVELEILKKHVWDHNSVGYELLYLILISLLSFS